MLFMAFDQTIDIPYIMWEYYGDLTDDDILWSNYNFYTVRSALRFAIKS